MAGTAPRSINPGAKPDVSIGKRLESPGPNAAVSKFRLLARPDAADLIECTELARPSDLCEDVLSAICKPPKPLLVREKRSIEGREECEKWF